MTFPDPCVYIIDDDKMLTSSIDFLVKSLGYNVHVLNNAEGFLEIYDPHQPSCLILDVRMPHISGLELQLILLEKQVEVPIIFMSAHGDIPMALEAIKKGADDFLTKPLNNQKLLEAINKSIKKDRHRLKRNIQYAQCKKLYDSLTSRQKEIMKLLIDGHPTKIVARKLNISANTVDVHRANIFKKMRVRCLSELITQLLNRSVLDLISLDSPHLNEKEQSFS